MAILSHRPESVALNASHSRQLNPLILGRGSHRTRHVVFTLGDARSFSGLTSKIPPLGSMLSFDADVKKTSARHQVKSASRVTSQRVWRPVWVHTGTHVSGSSSGSVPWCILLLGPRGEPQHHEVDPNAGDRVKQCYTREPLKLSCFLRPRGQRQADFAATF